MKKIIGLIFLIGILAASAFGDIPLSEREALIALSENNNRVIELNFSGNNLGSNAKCVGN